MKYAQLVIGPAGTGKSTYCHVMQEHGSAVGRTIHVANLDPAAEVFRYSAAFDIRDLISVDDVMEHVHLGPNGGLIYCMEYLADNFDWFEEQISDFGEDDYLILDCPGQIELYSHINVMKRVTDGLRGEGFNVCGVFLLDAMYITDAAKLMSGCLSALTAMVHLELPHVNVLTKCDLTDMKLVRRFLNPSVKDVVKELQATTGPRFKRLNEAFGSIIEDYSLVSFVPLNIAKTSSVEIVLAHVDNALQYGEDMEPKIPKDLDGPEPAPPPEE